MVQIRTVCLLPARPGITKIIKVTFMGLKRIQFFFQDWMDLRNRFNIEPRNNLIVFRERCNSAIRPAIDWWMIRDAIGPSSIPLW
jgi:hypothetical protein